MTMPVSPFLSDSGPCVQPEAAAASNESPQSPDAAADLSLIAEIFIGAARLEESRFKLDTERFLLDLEEPPLFLRRAG
jgi:hypothetical protein